MPPLSGVMGAVLLAPYEKNGDGGDMTDLLLSPPAMPTLPVLGGGVIGVNRIFCVGKNYAAHALEMGGDPTTEPPVFFSKPAVSVVPDGATIPFPPATDNLHYEAELAFVIGTGGAAIAPDDAMGHIWGWAAANDLTRRDLQAAAKAQGNPWDMAKGFDHSAIIGAVSRTAPAPDATIRCTVDGQVTQSAKISDMIWPVPQIIAHLSRLVHLHPCDLILTGTPEGVGPLQRGQTCVVEITDLPSASVTVR